MKQHHECDRCAEFEEIAVQMQRALIGSARASCDLSSLTEGERRVYECLLSNLDREVKRDRLDYVSRPVYSWATGAHNKLDVVMCRIRRKMREANSPYKIVTVYGYGFKMERITAPCGAQDK